MAKTITIEVEIKETRKMAIDLAALLTARDAIGDMFTWAQSREGRDYWVGVADKLGDYISLAQETTS